MRTGILLLIGLGPLLTLLLLGIPPLIAVLVTTAGFVVAFFWTPSLADIKGCRQLNLSYAGKYRFSLWLWVGPQVRVFSADEAPPDEKELIDIAKSFLVTREEWREQLGRQRAISFYTANGTHQLSIVAAPWENKLRVLRKTDAGFFAGRYDLVKEIEIPLPQGWGSNSTSKKRV